MTLEEVVHIRSVLTKAELESLPVEGQVKEDVEKRKVFFSAIELRNARSLHEFTIFFFFFSSFSNLGVI